MAEWSIATVLKTVNVKAFAGSNPVLSFLNTMIKIQAEEIKTRIEFMNRHYAPIKLNFKMYPSERPNYDDNLWITIVYNYTPEEWMEFVTIGFNYNQVCDKLFGFGFGLESVKMYQEEYGNLKFSQSDLPLG